MGFHLIDQAACFAVGQPTVRVCVVRRGQILGVARPALSRRQRVFGWLAWLTAPQRQSNGLQRCNSLLGCGSAKPYIGSLAVSMALQRLRQLSASMCRRDGVGGGAVQRHGRCGVRGCGLNGPIGGWGGLCYAF